MAQSQKTTKDVGSGLSKTYGQHGPNLVVTPLEVHVGAPPSLQTRRDNANTGGSTGTKTSPSSAGNDSGGGSRAPTALAGWSPTSMTTTASMSVTPSPGLMDTSQGSVSKGATDTPSPQGDITMTSNSQPETPSPPRRREKSLTPTVKMPQVGSAAAFKPRASLYNNVHDDYINNGVGAALKSDHTDSVVVMRKKQHPRNGRGRGGGGRDGNHLLRSAIEKYFHDPSNKELDDYVRYVFSHTNTKIHIFKTYSPMRK